MNRPLWKVLMLVVCACARCVGQGIAQEEVRFWMPIHFDDTWIYQHESANARWKTEEVVDKAFAVREGEIIVRRIRVLDGKPPVVPPKEAAWLIHDDCLYDLEPGEWDARNPKHLSAAFSAKPPWAGGQHARVICFPLSVGKTWGQESGHPWRVVEANDQDPSSPDRGRTFHLSYSTDPGVTEDVWFERGVGIVKGRGAQLLLYDPAPQRAIGRVPPPLGEVGLQYSYNSLSTSTSNSSNQSGGSVYGQYFFKQAAEGWRRRALLSLMGEFSGSGSGSGRLDTVLFGPRFGFEWRRAHLVDFFEPVLGASHPQVNGVMPAGFPVTGMRTSFAYGANYGIQVLAGQHYVVTLFQLGEITQEVPEPVSGTSRWRDDFRASAGVGFRFGGR